MIIKNEEVLLQELNNGTLKEHVHSNVELKSSWKQEYGVDISGLGNRISEDPQWLIVGVNDDGTLTGHNEKNIKQIEQLISDQCNKLLKPSETIDIIKTYLIKNGAWIIIIKINNPGDVVYWNSSVYKATGTTTERMQDDEIMSFKISLPGKKDFSAQNIIADIDDELVNKFCLDYDNNTKINHTFSISQLNTSESLERIGINNTQTSKLLFGKTPFRIIIYDKNKDIVYNTTYYSLYKILDLNLFRDLYIKYYSKNIVDDYPEKALKEGIANAVVHSAYYQNNGDIIIEISHNKIVIGNICLPLSNAFANKWFSNSHFSINIKLMETLRLAGYVDEIGRGKNTIFSECLKMGLQMPNVIIENAGIYNRWKLELSNMTPGTNMQKLFKRIREDIYPENDGKALLAYALVLWQERSITEINKYIDDSFLSTFNAIVSEQQSPIFSYEDELILKRWAKVILDSGKLSKQLHEKEEEILFDFCKKSFKKVNGIITNKEFRQIAGFAESKSEISLSSIIMTKWKNENKIKKLAKGKYQFIYE